VLGGLERELARRHRRRVEPHARGAVAFDFLLDPHEHLRVHGLRAGVAAPQPPRHGGEQEQRQRRDDQQDREVDDVLRKEDQAEDVELAVRDVEQHRLALVPRQPGEAVEDELGGPHQRPAPAGEPAVHRARVDGLADLVEGLLDDPRGRVVRLHLGERESEST
jgi:hypothetical protein